MGKRKNMLMKKITSYICILCLLLASSVVNFHYILKKNSESLNKTNQYNQIYLLLYELDVMIKDLDRFVSRYEVTQNPIYMDMYKERVEIYLGESERSREHFVIYYDTTISFQDLITNEINQYNPAYMTKLNNILFYVNDYISSKNTSSDHNNALNLSVVEPSTGNHFYDLNLKLSNLIKSFENDLLNDYTLIQETLSQQINRLYLSLYSIIGFTTIYLFYILYRVYILCIKPILEGHQLVEEISMGNPNKKWVYNHNNEFKYLVDSFNNYVDMNQKSYSLIAEQYYKLKLYSDIGEVNYFEFDFEKAELSIFYSKKFVEKYQLENSVIVYKAREYLKLIHKNDLPQVELSLKSVLQKKINEFKIEFRVKYPNNDLYCFISCTGQRKVMGKEVFMGVIFDITDLKNTQKQLLEQEEQYRIIIENSTDLIAKFDSLGNIVYASKSYSDTFKHENIVGANTNEFNHQLKVANFNWLDKVLKPPYSTQEVILIETEEGDKWISFKNDALLNTQNEVESIISVGHDITELQKMNDKLKFDSEHDLLTGLLNRRGLFNKIAELEISTIACFFIDINNFKNINDFYGHEIGDIIIKKVADELKVFKDRNFIISRLSGDEFVLLAPNYNTNFNLSLLKTQLSKNLQRNYHINNNNIYISSSVGYALYPEDTTDINKLIPYADIAMYEAKIAQDRHCVRFSKEMFDAINNKVEIANDLKKAIDEDQFEMVFQEIIDTKSNTINFVEALVRWEHPVKGRIGPNEFIPVAKETGLMEILDLLIINKSLHDFIEIKKMDFYEYTKLSLNVSPIMLLKKDFPSQLLHKVVKLGILVSDISIEISENTFINNIDSCRVQIKKLRKLGFLVALDDFGREYSSLSILDRVEFDIIKIDRLFVNNLDHEVNVEIIKMISKIAKLQNKLVIVEGVETNNQVLKLNQLGCTLMQGYYFSIPHKVELTITQ